MEEFAKTATAAKVAGAFHETAGLLKRKIGEFTDDENLKNGGRDQQLMGKVMRFVGTIRSLRSTVVDKYATTTKEAQEVCIKHGGRLLDVASDFVEDMKKTLFK